jgi:hypothetical protein
VIDNSEGKYLFHGTGMYCLAAIITGNRLDEGAYWGKPNEPHGPRFTESLPVAADFVIYNAYYGEGGVLVLDRQLLAQDYELRPYVDTVSGESRHDEQEIAVITSAITNLEKYLVAIIVEPAFIEGMCTDDFFETAWSEGGWPSRCSSDATGAAEMRAMLRSLEGHRLLNAIGTPEDIPRHGNIVLPAYAPGI